jgi:hypothetical protein
MGLADKVIKRLEQQADTIAQYRQLDEKRRSQICELERKLGDAEREQDIARVEIETLRQERDLAQAALTRERQVLQHEASDDYVELARLRAFVEVMRGLLTEEYADQHISAALAELDAGTSEPAPVAETLDAESGA